MGPPKRGRVKRRNQDNAEKSADGSAAALAEGLKQVRDGFARSRARLKKGPQQNADAMSNPEGEGQKEDDAMSKPEGEGHQENDAMSKLEGEGHQEDDAASKPEGKGKQKDDEMKDTAKKLEEMIDELKNTQSLLEDTRSKLDRDMKTLENLKGNENVKDKEELKELQKQYDELVKKKNVAAKLCGQLASAQRKLNEEVNDLRNAKQEAASMLRKADQDRKKLVDTEKALQQTMDLYRKLRQENVDIVDDLQKKDMILLAQEKEINENKEKIEKLQKEMQLKGDIDKEKLRKMEMELRDMTEKNAELEMGHALLQDAFRKQDKLLSDMHMLNNDRHAALEELERDMHYLKSLNEKLNEDKRSLQEAKMLLEQARDMDVQKARRDGFFQGQQTYIMDRGIDLLERRMKLRHDRGVVSRMMHVIEEEQKKDVYLNDADTLLEFLVTAEDLKVLFDTHREMEQYSDRSHATLLRDMVDGAMLQLFLLWRTYYAQCSVHGIPATHKSYAILRKVDGICQDAMKMIHEDSKRLQDMLCWKLIDVSISIGARVLSILNYLREKQGNGASATFTLEERNKACLAYPWLNLWLNCAAQHAVAEKWGLDAYYLAGAKVVCDVHGDYSVVVTVERKDLSYEEESQLEKSNSTGDDDSSTKSFKSTRSSRVERKEFSYEKESQLEKSNSTGDDDLSMKSTSSSTAAAAAAAARLNLHHQSLPFLQTIDEEYIGKMRSLVQRLASYNQQLSNAMQNMRNDQKIDSFLPDEENVIDEKNVSVIWESGLLLFQDIYEIINYIRSNPSEYDEASFQKFVQSMAKSISILWIRFSSNALTQGFTKSSYGNSEYCKVVYNMIRGKIGQLKSSLKEE